MQHAYLLRVVCPHGDTKVSGAVPMGNNGGAERKYRTSDRAVPKANNGGAQSDDYSVDDMLVIVD